MMEQPAAIGEVANAAPCPTGVTAVRTRGTSLPAARAMSLSVLVASGLIVWPAVGSTEAATPRPVKPTVRHVELARTATTGPAVSPAPLGLGAADDLVSTVEGAAPLVGISWARGSAPSPGTTILVRARGDSGWSDWTPIEVDDADDPAAAAGTTRVGTDPLWVGSADTVQVRYGKGDRAAVAKGRLELVEPGTSPADQPASAPPATAGAMAARPSIISRAGWGADESLRSCGPRYGSTTSALVVHHTAGSNTYTTAEVPGIIRGIYAYHATSLGWCDIGYNALVDKYGRIFEGRHGGLDLAVTGAHAGGFNTNTFGVSLLGSYDSVTPSSAALAAFERIFAWRAGTFYVDVTKKVTLTSGSGSSRYPTVGTPVTLPTIYGHRDTSLTA